MSKFSLSKLLSLRTRAPNTFNFAGGSAYRMDPRLEFVSVLLTTFVEDSFYRKEKQTVEHLRKLLFAVNDPLFVAKAAVYARRVHGMRSVSHVVAGELAKSVKGADWSRAFFDRVVRRPDDATEILAYYLSHYGRPVPNALKKGLGAALSRFDGYQLAKYRRDHAEFKLVDAVNLVRPKSTEALTALVKGTLAPADTWETRLAQAGEADAPEESKSDAWASLVRERKLGYLALLRNIRNILKQAPEVAEDLATQLENSDSVRRSLIFPFQFLTAVDILRDGNLPGAARVLQALNVAIDASLANVPRFEGTTLIALDSSGSMQGRPQKIGSLFAAALVKALGADLLLFSDDARYVTLNRQDSTLSAAQSLPFISGGTNFNAIFERANRAYDRVIILSDMQGWIGSGAPVATFAAYQRRQKAAPRVFSFDLNGYGTLQFPQEKVVCVAGWSDRVFELLAKLDRDPKALLAEVEATSFET